MDYKGRELSDVMMTGIATMPYELAMSDELSRRQFYANTQCLVAALEAAKEALDALKAENEALQEEVERLRTDGASAVRWAPGSAYWSEVLVELFGPDARKGIDVLETMWRKEIERAERLADALRELEERAQRDEALLRRVL